MTLARILIVLFVVAACGNDSSAPSVTEQQTKVDRTIEAGHTEVVLVPAE